MLLVGRRENSSPLHARRIVAVRESLGVVRLDFADDRTGTLGGGD